MTPRKARLSRGAQKDLTDIRTYIRRDNEVRAKTFVLEIKDAIQHHATLGLVGTARDDLRTGLRMLPHGDYTVYFYS